MCRIPFLGVFKQKVPKRGCGAWHFWHFCKKQRKTLSFKSEGFLV